MVSGTLRIRRLMLILGDPSRWAIARALEAGGRCVTDLARTVGLSQSCTTRHLQALERERIVHSSRDGKRVFYALRVEDLQVAGVLAMVLRAEPVASGTSHEPPARRALPAPGTAGGRRRATGRPAPALRSETVAQVEAALATAREAEPAPAAPPPVTEVPASEVPGPSPSAFRIRSEIEDYLL
jgi:DNA-binding transcriptional ArsR family regulator